MSAWGTSQGPFEALHSWIWALFIFAFVPQKSPSCFPSPEDVDSFSDGAERCSQEFNWQPPAQSVPLPRPPPHLPDLMAC